MSEFALWVRINPCKLLGPVISLQSRGIHLCCSQGTERSQESIVSKVLQFKNCQTALNYLHFEIQVQVQTQRLDIFYTLLMNLTASLIGHNSYCGDFEHSCKTVKYSIPNNLGLKGRFQYSFKKSVNCKERGSDCGLFFLSIFPAFTRQNEVRCI